MSTNCLFHVTSDEVNRAAGQAASDCRGWLYSNVMLLGDLPLMSGAAILVDLDYCFDADDFEHVLVALYVDCHIAVHGFNFTEMDALRWQMRGVHVRRRFDEALAGLEPMTVTTPIAEPIVPLTDNAKTIRHPEKIIEAA